jgi:hypothetical protein
MKTSNIRQGKNQAHRFSDAQTGTPYAALVKTNGNTANAAKPKMAGRAPQARPATATAANFRRRGMEKGSGLCMGLNKDRPTLKRRREERSLESWERGEAVRNVFEDATAP